MSAADMLKPIKRWFMLRGWSVFDFQHETWQAYLNGESGLVHAPTGTGKTLAVWLGPLAEAMACDDVKQQALRVLWITPLRALANDTAENLRAAADGLGVPWKIELRHGDTSSSVRARQRKQLPHALITTPESLSLLLSYPGCTQQFAGLRCVIVDEWHELLGSKRGVQTELALARLRTLASSLRTWGLSATLGNLDEAMRVLLGSRAAQGRLICGANPKQTIVETLRPESIERFPWAGHLGATLLPQVIDSIESANTTLLFTNVRSQAELWFQQLMKARPDLIGQIALHHGSLDRDIRAQVETLLRDGRIKCVVCTSSLDLGVDFSPVDQVMQLGSPKGIARMMQRAGRSGHQPGAISKIIGVPTNALELVEFAAAREAATPPSEARDASPLSLSVEGPPEGLGVRVRNERAASDDKATRLAHPHPHPSPLPQQRGRGSTAHIESREPIDRPLDVLVQHLVTLACGDGFTIEQLQSEIRGTHAFAKLTDQEWQWCLDFVTHGGASLRAYPQYAKIKPDERGVFLSASPLITRLHRMTIGTITSDAMVKVMLKRTTLGHMEESFLSRLNPEDRFVFAGQVLELVRLRNMTAEVRKAKGKSGIVPRWGGGRSPLSTLLSRAIRRKLDEARQGEFNSPEMETVRPLLELQGHWSIIPAPKELLIEVTRTRDGHHVFVFPFEGRLVHEGLSALIAHRIAAQEARSMQITANDYGFELLSPSEQPIELAEDEWRQVFTTNDLVRDLLECLNTNALARRQFRDIARVAGLIFPGFPGQSKTARQLQASSELFFDVFTEFDPGNLLLDQARREVMDRELEVTRLRQTLERIADSEIRIIATERLTPLSFPLWSESIRTQHITSESWHDRVQRMVLQLEEEAEATGAAFDRGRSKRRRPKKKPPAKRQGAT